MKQTIISVLCAVMVLVAMPGQAQVVEKVVPGFVLINTDIGIGQPGKILYAYRLDGGKIYYVARLKILRFQDGKTAAQVLEQEPYLRIAVGDRILGEKIKKDRLSAPPATASTAPRQPVVQQRTTGEASASRTASAQKALQIPSRPKPFLALSLGRFMPQIEMESFEDNYLIGATVRFLQAGRHALYADVTYPIMTPKPPDLLDLKSMMVTLHLVDHIRMGDQGHYDIGGGIYYYNVTMDILGETISESKTYLGGFFGYSIDIPFRNGLFVSPYFRFHLYQGELDWTGYMTGGVNIYLPFF